MPASVVESRRHQLGLVGVLALVMACGTIIAPALAVLASFLLDDLGLSRSELGWVIGAFSISAAILSPRAGLITDRIGGRRAALGVFGGAAVALAVVAGSTTAWVLAVGAVIGGVAQSAANPSTNKLIAGLIPVGRRGLVVGFKQSGVQVGVLVTGLMLPPAALAWGWEIAVALLLALPLTGLLLAWRLVPPSGVTSGTTSGVKRGPVPGAIWWLAGYGFLMGLAGGSIASYLPLFSEEAVGLSVSAAGVVAAVSGAAAFVARIWFAHLSEEVRQFAWPLGMIAAGAVMATGLLLVAQGVAGWLLWPAALLAGATTGAWNSVAMLAVISETGPEGAGHGSGIVLSGFLFGFGIGPPIFGATVDAASDYRLALTGALVLFGLAALSMVGWSAFNRRNTAVV